MDYQLHFIGLIRSILASVWGSCPNIRQNEVSYFDYNVVRQSPCCKKKITRCSWQLSTDRLLCEDVKFRSKVLAHRLQCVLPKWIHQDLIAFVRVKSMHHHIRHLTDIQDLVTIVGKKAHAAFLEFWKSYDRQLDVHVSRVVRNGYWKFINWVLLSYNNTNAQLRINAKSNRPLHHNVE